ncbi:MAG: type I-B CRISPR-associated endonuclease Cas1 [Bacteroidetes bacterium]|nr:type I-B CRISPR-associated endonuclease Cas1 [Bacteroidota bacterium]
MKKSYYLLNPGSLSRKDNTLKFSPSTEDGANPAKDRYLPIEGINQLYIFGALDLNTAMLNYVGQQNIALHFFDYYNNYTGSFMPREQLQSGSVKLLQAKTILHKAKRLEIARELIEAAARNMIRNLRYYHNRGKNLQEGINSLSNRAEMLTHSKDIPTLMGIEGQIRQAYYQTFDLILDHKLIFQARTKQPPENELNALISFGNSLCYAECLRAIHQTQLDPTLSFLHEPGYRRFSLALDLAEVFKPLLVDRMIFQLVNRQQINKESFYPDMGGTLLKEAGRDTYLRAWEERLNTTLQHLALKRSVSYRYLLRLECYKIIKAIMKIEPYKAFRLNW